ncbi:hypothetical protein TNCV_3303511 [Trichonephila clavipes]|nr:hypothetical protein TNCV_3303511 [Trichonephila clavipes]
MVDFQPSTSFPIEKFLCAPMPSVIGVMSYSRAFGDELCNFGSWSSDEDDTSQLALSFPNFHTTTTGGRLRSRQILHRSPTRQVFSGTRLELMIRRSRVRNLGYQGLDAEDTFLITIHFSVMFPRLPVMLCFL